MSKSLEERRAKAEAELASIQKEEEERARYKDSLIAGAVKAAMDDDEAFRHQIIVLLDKGLRKQRDRQLFDLPRKTQPKKCEPEQDIPPNGLAFFQKTSAN